MRRTRLSTRLGAACGFALTGWLVLNAQQSPPADQQRPVFRAGTAVVEVDAYPRLDGRIAEGLTIDDFEIFEDGVPQSIQGVEFIRIEPFIPETEVRDPNNQREMLERVSDPHNRAFVIYLDRYHVRVLGSARARRPLVDLLHRILAPTDLFAVMTHGLPVNAVTFGRRTESIEEQLTRYWPWGERSGMLREPEDDALAACYEYTREGLERWGADGAVERPLIDILVMRRREDAVLTHLEDLVAYLGAVRESRKVLVVLTEGWVLFEPDRETLETLAEATAGALPPAGRPPEIVERTGNTTITSRVVSGTDCYTEAARILELDNGVRFRRLLEIANQNNVTFYPVHPSGMQVFDSAPNERTQAPPAGFYAPTSSRRQGTPDEVMRQELGRVTDRRDTLLTLAENTDGLAVLGNDLAAGLRQVVDDVSAYYLLTYESSNTASDGMYRSIDVRVRRPDVQVRARRGYFAPSAEAGRLLAEGPDPSLAAVEEALGVLSRLRTDARLFLQGTVSSQAAQVVVELSSGEVRNWPEGADVEVRVSKANGEPVGTGRSRIEPATRGTLVRVPLGFDLMGPWRATVVIGAGADRIQDGIEFGESTGLLLGDPVVYRARPSPRAPLYAAADSRFRRTERVHIEWPVFDALDRREARLLSREGQPLAVPVTVTEREVDGVAQVAADLNLAPLTDGDYVIELVIGRGGETQRALVAIRVLR
jgi:VWFA-related protein